MHSSGETEKMRGVKKKNLCMCGGGGGGGAGVTK